MRGLVHCVRRAERDRQTGKTLQLFKGHTAPVTSLAFVDRTPGSGKEDLLITGSWDQVDGFCYANYALRLLTDIL